MADEDRITGRTSNVRQLFTGRRYTIDTYQREYSWETKHVEDLIQDLSQRFLGQWGPLHERRDVQHYQSYFLGPIITTASERINLIDGQQRLTTLTLLLIFLRRLQEGREDAVADLGPLVYSQLYGEEAFTLDIGDRRRGMTAVLRGQELDPRKASPSERTLMARYRDIEETFPETLRGEALPFFIDWLLGRVVVVEIVTHDAATGQEIFETMNDRGQRLTSLDMLKSYLVGRARRHAPDVHESWRTNLASLAELDPDGPADLVKYWLRARYARDDADDAAIDTAVHQWVRRHNRVLGLYRPVDYRDFVSYELRRGADRYRQLLAAARQLTPGLEPVYYNAYNKLPLQFPLILSALQAGDTEDEFVSKARMVAGFLDIFVARSMLSYQDFRQAPVWRRILSLSRVLRRMEGPEMGARLAAELTALGAEASPAEAFGLRQRNRSHVKYLLARMTAWVDQQCGGEHDFAWYGPGHYEIEHVLANRPTGGKAFGELRNRFGALVLLPKATNAGFGALPYERKLPLYLSQNLLARSLHPACYERNPTFMRFVTDTGLPFQPYPDRFDESVIAARQDLYLRIAARVWDPAAVGLPAVAPDGLPLGDVAPLAPRQRRASPLSLADLLRAGTLRPGRLVGEHLGTEYVAELTVQGTVRLDTGAEFTSPSAAAMTALDRPSWNGWTFWAVEYPGGLRTKLDVIRRAALAGGLGTPAPEQPAA
ncbi:MAG: hypothetical protein AUI14_09550 [Actinobacteria bacterium 13_2_20CM_2_71_6]|nr:MAG: hypothetical protein AUI14_09550 [Actinobacteria bacterium 13_2_20CM_2_71_6]